VHWFATFICIRVHIAARSAYSATGMGEGHTPPATGNSRAVSCSDHRGFGRVHDEPRRDHDRRQGSFRTEVPIAPEPISFVRHTVVRRQISRLRRCAPDLQACRAGAHRPSKQRCTAGPCAPRICAICPRNRPAAVRYPRHAQRCNPTSLGSSLGSAQGPTAGPSCEN
jgi:hypothetical protein